MIHALLVASSGHDALPIPFVMATGRTLLALLAPWGSAVHASLSPLIVAGRASAPFFIAGATLAAVLGTAVGLSRAVRRQVRTDRRDRRDALADTLARVARKQQDLGSMAAVCQAVDAETFWRAVDRDDTRRGDRARLRLGRGLMTVSHVRVERERLFDDDPARAHAAAGRLGCLPSPESRRDLRRALALGPEPVAAAAARALARHRDRAALRWILARPQRLKRRSVAVWIGLLRGFGRRGLPVIAAALERGVEDRRLLRAGYEALGFGGYRDGTAAIARGLEHKDEEVRIAAARALGRLRAGDQAAALTATLRDRVWQVRALGAWALGRARVADALAPLTASVNDRAWWVRRHSAYALARLGAPGLEALRGVAAGSPDRYAREMAQEALDVTARHRER